MPSQIILRSFVDLGRVLGIEQDPEPEIDEVEAVECTETPDEADELGALLAELEAAGATLARAAQQDQEARDTALRDLSQYDELLTLQQEAESVAERAGRIRQDAVTLVTEAFTEEGRVAAQQAQDLANRAVEVAQRTAAKRRAEAERLVERLDLERLLAERRRQEEAEKAKAAEAERARRLSNALVRATQALRSGQIDEAKALLGTVTSDTTNNPDVSSLLQIIAQRELGVKVERAEEALREARRLERREPAEAVARLEALDVVGLPDPLARQVFGEWARACSRRCRNRGLVEPLRYAPEPGQGAVLVRESSS